MRCSLGLLLSLIGHVLALEECCERHQGLSYGVSPTCAGLEPLPSPSLVTAPANPVVEQTSSVVSSTHEATYTQELPSHAESSQVESTITSRVNIPTPLPTLARTEDLPFLSFAAWKERQEQIWDANYSFSRRPEPKTPAAVPPPELEPVQEEEQALAEPIRYIHPLPFSGTGLPDDPLTRLSSRTNFAGVDCSASVLRSSKNSKGASSILHSAKDRYMLTPCEAKEKFVVIELCEEIDVDSIVLANWEFFSSMFKVFRVLGSANYPGSEGDWTTLGLFRAGNVRAPQAFSLPRPSAPRFFKYLRLEFLSHYGSEHFCPVSLVRVYGRSQLDAFRDEEAARHAQQILLRDLEEQREDVHVEVRLSEVESATMEDEQTVVQEKSRLEEESAWPSIELPSQVEASPTTISVPSTSTAIREVASTHTQEHVPTESQKTVESTSTSASTSSSTSISATDSLATPTVPILSSSFVSNESLPITESHKMTSEAIISSSKSAEKQPDSPIARRNETRPIPPHATGGESVYGAIAKRITNLERDSSLTLKYIEEQAKFFQRLFGRLEAKLGDVQIAQNKNEAMLRKLAMEFEFHRSKVEEERLSMSTQVNMLAQEIVFEKRLGIAQLIALVGLLLGFIFTRSSTGPFLQLVDPKGTCSSHRNRIPPVPSSARRPEKEKIVRSSRDVTRQNSKKGVSRAPARLPLLPIRNRHDSAPPQLIRSLTPPPRLETTEDTFLVPPIPPRSIGKRRPRLREPFSPTVPLQESQAMLKRMPSDRWTTDADSDLDEGFSGVHSFTERLGVSVR